MIKSGKQQWLLLFCSLPLWGIVLSFLGILCCGAACSQEELNDEIPVAVDQNNNSFVTLDARLALTRRIRRAEYVAGQEGQLLQLKLQNTELKQVHINGWFSEEEYNAKVYYALCQPGKSAEVKDEDWILVHPEENFVRSAHQRTILTLDPNISTLIDVPLRFLTKFQIPKNQATCTLAMKAELNTSVLSAKTDVFEVTIRPKVRDYRIP